MCWFIGSIYTLPDLISQQDAIGGFEVDFHCLFSNHRIAYILLQIESFDVISL